MSVLLLLALVLFCLVVLRVGFGNLFVAGFLVVAFFYIAGGGFAIH